MTARLLVLLLFPWVWESACGLSPFPPCCLHPSTCLPSLDRASLTTGTSPDPATQAVKWTTGRMSNGVGVSTTFRESSGWCGEGEVLTSGDPSLREETHRLSAATDLEGDSELP